MKNIIAAVDFSDATPAIVSQASALARAFGAKLWLIHVGAPEPDFVTFEPGPEVVRKEVAKQLREQHRRIEQLAQSTAENGIDVTGLLVQGAAVDQIIEQAKKQQADLIVVGSHGHGAVFRVLLGSVSEGVVRHAHRPVLVIPAPTK